MNRIVLSFLIGCTPLLGSYAAAPEPVAIETFEATLVKFQPTADVLLVKKGDETELPIRLFGVACPVAGQPFARNAEDFLARTLNGATVTVEVLTVDAEELPVARIRPPEGPSIGQQLLQEGLAWCDEPNVSDDKRLKKLAAEALLAGKGLWRDAAPLAPWDYRMSQGMPPVTYLVKSEPVAEAQKPKPESGTTTLAAKGTAKPRPPMAQAPAPEDYLALAAKHQPHIARDSQGNPLGLTASNIAGIPGANQIGFRDGDIVRSVNGITLTSEAQLFGLVGQLQGAKQLTLQVIRDGKPVTINIPL